MALVRDVFRHDPLSGPLFIFFSKRCDRVRIVYWDRNGYASIAATYAATGVAVPGSVNLVSRIWYPHYELVHSRDRPRP
jgi:hypothetical protein